MYGWELLENGGAIYRDAETDEARIYGADGVLVATVTVPTPEQLAVAAQRAPLIATTELPL